MKEPAIALLQQREIEAKIVGPIYRAFAREIGDERARQILSSVIVELARGSGCAAAEAMGGDSLEHLERAVDNWTRGDALSLEIIRRDESALEFNVSRCRFAEMYRRLGLEELGPILSCNRDGAMIEGFNSEIQLTRTQTIMQGATHCDFRYRKHEKT